MTYKVLGLLAILTVFAMGTSALGFLIDPGSLGDRVWWDQDKDGVQDPGEPGLPGATVELWQGSTLIGTQQTVADGYYLFTGLESGPYQVTITALPASPNGGTWVQTYDLDGVATANTAGRELGFTYSLPGDPVYDPYGDGAIVEIVEHATDVDFGYATIGNQSALGAIGDFVWNDLDRDGLQDSGEAGIEGAVVELIQDTNKSGLFGDTVWDNDLGQYVTDAVQTQTTNASGYYLFTGLEAGNYRITVTAMPPAPGGSTWEQTFDKDDGPIPATFLTPNQMANQLLQGWYVTGSDGLLVWTVETVLDVDFGYTVADRFTTYTPGAWGAPPSGNNAAAMLVKNWYIVAGLNPLLVGYKPGNPGTGPYTITLTTAKAVENFLPPGGTAGALVRNYINPTKTSAGNFAGHVTALKLSVLFSEAGLLRPGLADQVAVQGPLAGKTVAEILDICEAALSGGSTFGLTYDQLLSVAAAINMNYDNGTADNGYLASP